MTYETMLMRFQGAAERVEDRLELLKHYAGLIPEDRTPEPEAVRAESVSYHALECFACLSRDWMTYWHHVVQVQHGGDNDPRNLVSICHRCHQRVHPWLKDGTTAERRSGFVRLGDHMAAVRS
jgi:5-methylcytosine-specific restriction endonuclease McrA